MTDEQTLKPGWKQVKFGEVVRLSKARSANPEADGIERYVGLEHLDPEDLRIRRWGLVAEGTTFTTRFKPGQVLFGKRRAYQRKVAIADFEGVCSGDIYVFESANPSVLLPELLPFICQSDRFLKYAVGTSAGSLSPRTNWSSLANFEFSLPVSEIQQKIVELLESIRNTVETNLAATQHTKSLCLAIVNESIEKAIMDEESTKAFNINELGLEGEQVLKTGPFGSKLKTSYFQSSGIPVISIGSLKDEGLDSTEFFFLPSSIALEFEEYKTYPGDIVFSRVADVGRCHLITEEEAGYIISSNLIRIRVDKSKIKPTFLWLLIKHSVRLRKQLAKMTTQAAGRLLINTKTMSSLQLLVPTILKQEQIINDYEKLIHANRTLKTRFNSASNMLSSFREKLLF